jgi:peptidoglycan-associated lipoprotein
MTRKMIPMFFLLGSATAVSAGCSASAKANSDHPTAHAEVSSDADADADADLEAVAEVDAEADADADADADLDGSVSLNETGYPQPAEADLQYRYRYVFDYDDDGGYAAGPSTIASATTGKAMAFDVDAELLAKCKQASETFYFAFDSAKLASDVNDDLDNLVACLNSPKMQSEQVVIVGHADERGSNAYNLQLGRKRASAVADALGGHGLPDQRITVRSRGEQEADDPEYWDDRRVVIQLR